MTSRSQAPERARLLVVAPSAYPLGGIATWLDGLVLGLRERGREVDVALLAGRHHDVDRYLERHPLGAVRRVENRTGSREGRLRALSRAIEESGCDLVLGVNVGDLEDATDRARRRSGRPLRLVVSQHGLQGDFFGQVRANADQIDGVIATNRLSTALALRLGALPEERVAYAPYGVDFDVPTREESGDERLRILWVGRLEEGQKRVGDLAPIARRLQARGAPFLLTIAGTGPGEPRVSRALSGAIESGVVRLLGDTGHRRLLDEIYPQHDLLLLTSVWETGPIVAWEAIAAGLAVVSSRFVGSGLEGALRSDETALLFPVGETAAAAEQLERARDTALRARLVANGRAEVRSRYSRSASLKAWEHALDRLATVEPRGARTSELPIPARGRLDRWLGAAAAETVRAALGVRRRQAKAGDEWPHALGRHGDEAEFLRLAASLDRGEGAEGVGAA